MSASISNLVFNFAEARQFLQGLDPTPGAQYGSATFSDKGEDHRLATRLYGDLDQAVRLTGRKHGQLSSTVGILKFMPRLGAGTVQLLDGNGATARQAFLLSHTGVDPAMRAHCYHIATTNGGRAMP